MNRTFVIWNTIVSYVVMMGFSIVFLACIWAIDPKECGAADGIELGENGASPQCMYLDILGFSPDSQYALMWNCNQAVVVLDLNTKLEVQRFECSTRPKSIAFIPGGTEVLAAFSDVMEKWDIETGQKTTLFEFPDNTKTDTSAFRIISPDAKHVLATYSGVLAPIMVLDMETGAIISVLKQEYENRRMVSDEDNWYIHSGHATEFTPNGRILCTGGVCAKVRLWDTNTWELAYTSEFDLTGISVVFSNDENLAAFCASTSIQLVDLNERNIFHSLETENIPHGWAFNEDDTEIVAVDYEGNVIFWNTQTGERTRTFCVAENDGSYSYDDATYRALSPDGRYLLTRHFIQTSSSTRRHREGRLWDLQSQKLVYVFSESEYGDIGPDEGAFSKDSKKLLINDRNEQVWIFDISELTAESGIETFEQYQ